MKRLDKALNGPVPDHLTPARVGGMVALTALACLIGMPLASIFGPTSSYIPVVVAGLMNAWIGGLWPSLATQVTGCGLLFAFITLRFPSAPLNSRLWTLLAVALVGKLAMSLVLSLRYSRRLSNVKQHLEAIAEATHDSVWDWNLRSGKVWREGRLQEIFGCSRDQIVPDIGWWRSRIHPEQQSEVWESLQTAIGGLASRWNCEYRIRRDPESYIIVSDRVRILRDSTGKAYRVLGGMVDISAERSIEDLLIHDVSLDPLTRLSNRAAFLRRLKSSDGLLVRAVLFLSLDRFKVINDTLGREAGDQLLIEVGRRIKQRLRASDLASRFGSDEYAVLLTDLHDTADALRTADHILREFEAPFLVGANAVSVTASIGVGSSFDSAQEGEPALDLLQQAEIAMYQAKKQGGGRCQIFDPELEDLARRRARMEGQLRQSFQDGSLRLHYQPIVSLDDGSLASFEALLRWQHPSFGMIMPSAILPAVEGAGLSIQLGKWALRQSCERLRSWRETYAPLPLHINVNLSGVDFIRPALLDEIKELLRETGVPGECLVIELTETTIMESNIDVARRLSKLRDMGIRLALDDFGIGHSSLGRLQDFPISILKIDSSFVNQIGEGRRLILDAIIALGHELKLEITAEGVETREQLIYLRDRGTTKAQGLLFAPALAPEVAAKLFTNPPWDFQDLIEGSPKLSTGTAAS